MHANIGGLNFASHFYKKNYGIHKIWQLPCIKMLSLNYHFAYLFSDSQKIAYKDTKIEGDAST